MRPGTARGDVSFFFVRHGETDWNREGRLQGQRDIPLNARGRDQAAATGRTLRRLLGSRPLDVARLDFVSSPLDRARSTMELLRGAVGVPPRDYGLDDRLKELAFGAWEGRTWSEVKAADAEGYRARKRDKWGFIPPGGESYGCLAGRLVPWLDEVRRDAVVVAHGGVARALMVLLCGLDPGQAPAVEIHQGRILRFDEGRAAWI